MVLISSLVVVQFLWVLSRTFSFLKRGADLWRTWKKYFLEASWRTKINMSGALRIKPIRLHKLKRAQAVMIMLSNNNDIIIILFILLLSLLILLPVPITSTVTTIIIIIIITILLFYYYNPVSTYHYYYYFIISSTNIRLSIFIWCYCNIFFCYCKLSPKFNYFAILVVSIFLICYRT